MYMADFVVCVFLWERKMSCIINQGPLSNYVILEKRTTWRGSIMVLNTTLDGKVIKLSEELAREISANQHTNKPFRTKISKEDQTIDVMIWMRDERNVSRIRFDWFDKERSQNQYCLAFSDFCAEVVVINAIE